MHVRWILVLALAAGCGAGEPNGLPPGGGDNGNGATGPGGAPGGISGGGDASTPLVFAVFGDARPANVNQTAGYPSAVLAGIFKLAHDQGAQLVVGTGDYMFASTPSAVSAQVQLLQQAESAFGGAPIYLAMGNHECNGYTAGNCPNLTETANVQAFVKLLPAGATTPWYRVDVDTPHGKAKFVFVAANAWNATQQAWLKTQLADPTTYTFVIRHEPTSADTAPGVGPSDTLIAGAPLTLELLGHTHTYRRVNSQQVISGNGGAPLSGGSSYGLLLIEQQADGSLVGTELDEATGNASDTWKIDASGKAL